MSNIDLKIHLITTFYYSDEPDRNQENLKCLHNNINNPFINGIHLFLQGVEKPDLELFPEGLSKKITLIKFDRRPLFKDLFEYANSLNDTFIKVISNSDIYFDKSIVNIEKCLKYKDVVTLTRWDLQSDGKVVFYNNYKSQDCWFFRKIIPVDIGNFPLGQHGCDNRLLYELKKRGISYFNPSLSIKAIHVHQSNLRSYFKDPNYQYVDPPFEYALTNFCPGSEEQKSAELKRYYVLNRYNYYKSYSNCTLPGKTTTTFSRSFAFLFSKFWAFLYRNIGVSGMSDK
jgi:hypothetical protein